MKPIYLLITAGCLMGQSDIAIAQHKQRYEITDLGTLGGGYSYAYGLGDSGIVSGGSATAAQTGGLNQTAFLWHRGRITNLGTLDRWACPNCNSEAAAATPAGRVAIISETARLDPDGQDFCGFGTHRQCLAAIWKDGVMTALPTLPGGLNAQTYWMNTKGEAIGFSDTGTLDSTCIVPFQVRRFEAAKWSREGIIQRLAPLRGDTVAFAFGINEAGQAAGVSGLCSNVTLPPNGVPDGPHAVLWDKHGSPIPLGTLPGGVTTMPTSINNDGDIVGNVHFADGSLHPFLWTRKAGMRDLGVAPGDFVTVVPCCGTLNNRGDIAGFSCGPNGCRAVVYGKGGWVDLNTRISGGNTLKLQFVNSINDAGQLAGTGETSGGELHAFLATPVSR